MTTISGVGDYRELLEAVRWFRMAADQGDAGAQYKLAFMYETGRGVTKDLVRAHMWFDLAGRSAETPAHQHYAIQYRDSVASKMTPDQIAKAKKLAADWKPSLRSDICVIAGVRVVQCTLSLGRLRRLHALDRGKDTGSPAPR